MRESGNTKNSNTVLTERSEYSLKNEYFFSYRSGMFFPRNIRSERQEFIILFFQIILFMYFLSHKESMKEIFTHFSFQYNACLSLFNDG